MGGKEGGRGYLYQGIVAVLELLKRENWDQIYVEFPTVGDKVDIAIKREGQITDAIQVKSTANSFNKGEVSQWLTDIINDYPCRNYKLVLIGNCGPSAVNFLNALDKFQLKRVDNEAEKDLEGFNIGLLSGIQVEHKILPFNPDDLKSLVRDALSTYAYNTNCVLNPPQATLLVDAMIEDQLLKPTKGNYTDRLTFKEELDAQIKLIIKKHTKKREKIGIVSFSRGAEELPKEVSNLLDIREKFDGRFLKDGLDWTDSIGRKVQQFLIENTTADQAYQIAIEAHSSIAFTAGRIFDTKYGVDICPLQKTVNGWEIWDVDGSDQTTYQDWKIEHILWDKGGVDSALILNVSRNIYLDVERYLKEQGVLVGRVINCTLENVGGTDFAIQNGTHAAKLASTVYSALVQRSTAERRAHLHLFSAAPNAFTFYLGKISRPFGKCILYEYDLEQKDNCSYYPSISFGGEGGLE